MILKEQDDRCVYSDGETTEELMYKIAKQFPEDLSQDYIANKSTYTLNNTFSSVRQNILNWYPFKENADILEIGAGMGAITGMLCNKARHVTAIEMSKTRADVIKARYPDRENLLVISENINTWDTNERFDYIVFIGVLEYAAVFSDTKKPYDDFMLNVNKLLKSDGVVLFAIENRFGIKYWLGGSEDHLQEPYVGIEGYKEPKTPRTFSKKELEEILIAVGLKYYRFYSVLPDYKFPELIFSDDYTPDYMNLKKVSFTYSKNSSLVADEKELYKDIISNQVFPFFANSFLIEASRNDLENKRVIHVSAKGEVHKEYRVSTIIDNCNNVYKVPMHENAKMHIQNILQNTKHLAEHGVKVLPVELEEGKLKSIKFDGMIAQSVFTDALSCDDKNTVYKLINRLKEAYLLSSFVVEYNINNILIDNALAKDDFNYGLILQKAFVDMTFYNSFWVDDELIFFDQEWCYDRVPLNFCLYYSIKSVYQKADMITNISLNEILNYLNISPDEVVVYDKLEEIIWSKILYRQTDFYGEDGYCNRFSHEMTYHNQIAIYKKNLLLKENIIKEEEKKVISLNNKLDMQDKKIIDLSAQIDKLGKKKIDKDGIIYKNECLVNELIMKNSELEQIIRNKEGHIEQLLEVEREYEREKHSRTYRLSLIFRKVSIAFFPVDSKRRFFVGMIKKIIKKPKLMFKVVNLRRIRNFFAIYKEEGIESVKHHYQLVEEVECSRLNPFDSNQYKVANVELSEDKKIDEYKKISFKSFEEIDVSIIIPAHNQFNYTYHCLESILNNSGDIRYEVIIVDDCSTDLTAQIEDIISGIKVIHNKENLRFLLNCNNAAKKAKGKYIILLNNDTQVQEDWLRSMLELMEKDEKIGMTGSKLIYPDGWLQEAGGIFWSDASAWNYGNRKNPDDPEFNYVKEVDYISGASIMIRASLWNDIGGFDERFAPAYYEDSDLAFEIRKRGYKVVYQPLSVVIHFEGISNGTNIHSGQKSYQLANQQKFYEKWKDILEREHFPNGENIFLAKDRSRFKKHILVIDHYVPHFDQDAGGKCTYMYLLLFVKMGFKVTFIGDNFYKHEPYTTILNQQGVEVLYGNYYYNNWQAWLKENLHYFDYIYLQRPHISIKYIDHIKRYSHAKILYFAHDLHHVREYREYLLTKDEEKLKSSEKWKKIEYELFKKADVGHVVGTYEQEVMQKVFPEKPIRNIPLYIYEDILTDINKNFRSRKDILYVGGFGHAPNIDAVLWFGQNVLPKVLLKFPDLKWHVVGGKVPLEIQELASDNIYIEGFLSDEELHELYYNCRIAVVPLRVGAGVKGKVVEAAYYQIPIVTTNIGAEGLNTDVGNMVIEDDADSMANIICNLYENYDELADMSDSSIEFIKKFFMEDEAKRVLSLDIDF